MWSLSRYASTGAGCASFSYKSSMYWYTCCTNVWDQGTSECFVCTTRIFAGLVAAGKKMLCFGAIITGASDGGSPKLWPQAIAQETWCQVHQNPGVSDTGSVMWMLFLLFCCHVYYASQHVWPHPPHVCCPLQPSSFQIRAQVQMSVACNNQSVCTSWTLLLCTVVGQNPTLRIRCPLTHCTLLHAHILVGKLSSSR